MQFKDFHLSCSWYKRQLCLARLTSPYLIKVLQWSKKKKKKRNRASEMATVVKYDKLIDFTWLKTTTAKENKYGIIFLDRWEDQNVDSYRSSVWLVTQRWMRPGRAGSTVWSLCIEVFSFDKMTVSLQPMSRFSFLTTFTFSSHTHVRLLLPAGNKTLHLHFSSHPLPLTAQRTVNNHVGVAPAIGSHANGIQNKLKQQQQKKKNWIIQKCHLYSFVNKA